MKLAHFSSLVLASLLILLTTDIHAQYSPPDTSGYIEIEEASLYFRTVGEGTPLVIVHGGPGMSHDYLAPQFINLLSKDYRLIFYDQRGSGRSTGVKDTTRLTIEQFVEDLEEVRRTFNLGKMNLVGHSFGGLLAMYYAKTFPSQVKKLLLIDTAAASWELLFPYFRKTIADRRSDSSRKEMEKIEALENFGNDPEIMERYWHLFFQPFFDNQALSDSLDFNIDEQWLANYRVTSEHVQGNLGKYDIHDQLKSISCPTLILHGEGSTISIEAAKAIHSIIPMSQLIVFKDTGHFPYIEYPQTFKTAMKAFIW